MPRGTVTIGAAEFVSHLKAQPGFETTFLDMRVSFSSWTSGRPSSPIRWANFLVYSDSTVMILIDKTNEVKLDGGTPHLVPVHGAYFKHTRRGRRHKMRLPVGELEVLE